MAGGEKRASRCHDDRWGRIAGIDKMTKQRSDSSGCGSVIPILDALGGEKHDSRMTGC